MHMAKGLEAAGEGEGEGCSPGQSRCQHGGPPAPAVLGVNTSAMVALAPRAPSMPLPHKKKGRFLRPFQVTIKSSPMKGWSLFSSHHQGC